MATASVKEALSCGQCLSPCQLLGQRIGIWKNAWAIFALRHERESISYQDGFQ